MRHRNSYLMVDCVVFEEYCNLSCEYCFLHQNFRSKIPLDAAYNYKKNIEKMIGIAQSMDIPIFKLSGGEVFLLKGLVDLLKRAEGFERLQVLTNGTLLTKELINDLAKIRNFCMQITVDGHTFEMNKYRFPSEAGVKNLLNNVERVVDAGIPLELNLCLTRMNIGSLRPFIEYLMNLNSEKLILYPIPVREAGSRFHIFDEQMKFLNDIIDNYEQFRKVLPPRPYMVSLTEMLKTGRKSSGWICWVPQLIMGLQGNGDIKICPEVGSDIRTICGNLLEEDDKEPSTFLDNNLLHKLLKTRNRVIHLCKGCYTHYELINLYLNGMITVDELSGIWFFKNECIQKYLSFVGKGEMQ